MAGKAQVAQIWVFWTFLVLFFNGSSGSGPGHVSSELVFYPNPRAAAAPADDDDDSTTWGKTWTWEVEAPVDKVWGFSGQDFMRVDEWMTSVIINGTSVLVGGRSNEAGTCVRRVDCYRAAVLQPEQESAYPAELVFYGLQKLLSLDNQNRSFSYAAAGGNLPGFDVDGLVDYRSFFQVREHPASSEKAYVQWGYTSEPSPYITQEEGDQLCYALYDLAVSDLRKRLAAAPAGAAAQ